MLKTVGTSGQLTLGKKLAGRHFEMEQRADGSILLAPVTVTRATKSQHSETKASKHGRPSFHIFQVEQFELPKREERNQRRG